MIMTASGCIMHLEDQRHLARAAPYYDDRWGEWQNATWVQKDPGGPVSVAHTVGPFPARNSVALRTPWCIATY